jgi:hypothetical protein
LPATFLAVLVTPPNPKRSMKTDYELEQEVRSYLQTG